MISITLIFFQIPQIRMLDWKNRLMTNGTMQMKIIQMKKWKVELIF